MSESPKPPRPAPPSVFISYSLKDEKWKERLVYFLRPAVAEGLIELWDSSARVEAVTVALLSPDYLSDFGATTTSFGKFNIFPILIRACTWEETLFIKRQIFPPDARSLESRSPAEQDELLALAAKQIVSLAIAQASPAPMPSTIAAQDASAIAADLSGTQQAQPATTTSPSPDELTVNALSQFTLSNEARNILRRARVLATFGKGDEPKVSSSCVLFGISEGGRDQREVFITPQFFWRELQRADSKTYQQIFHERFPNAQYSSTNGLIAFDQFERLADVITGNVLNLFQRAQEISLATSRAVDPDPPQTSGRGPTLPIVHARHLLAALLVLEETRAMKRLATIIDVAQLRAEFLNFIEETTQDDFASWQNILDVPAPVSDGANVANQTETEADSRTLLAGFAADTWEGDDLLNITRDVNALASLVAARSIDPPLSIGLFGDWGSGKTHFMRQMRARVQKLSQQARDSGKPQSELGYHKKIVQIEFNAWHYIEGNLWASLVEHIFDNLRITGQRDGRTEVEDARQKIMEQLGLKQELQKKVEQRQEELKTKADAATVRAEEAKSQRDDKTKDLTDLRDAPEPGIIDKLTTIEVSPEQKALLKQFGIPEGVQEVPSEIHKRYEEARTAWGRIRAQWNVFRSDPKRLNKLIRVLVVIGIAVAVGFILRNYLKAAHAFLASAIAFIGAALAAAKPYFEKFKKGMAALKEKYDQVEKERQKQIVALESEVHSLTREMTAAENEAKAINQEVNTLETQLKSTDAARLLAGFIEDRAACEDYRRHLGMLALIRRDFEKLSNLLSEQRRDEREHGDAIENERAFSRIILYIDDLDRCPPEQVVKVLQAIHLLLAFPLFVVIVGVDARWVTRCLQESYDWLGVDGDANKDKEKDKQHTQERREMVEERVVTPHDYLEKIFQIPFWLKPMGDTDCANLLDGLTKDTRDNSRVSPDGDASKESQKQETTSTPAVTTEHSPAVDQAKETSAAGPTSTSAAQSEIEPVSKQNSAIETNPEPADAGRAAVAVGNQEAIKTTKSNPADEQIDLAPQSLTLSEDEIEFMKSLTTLIGRSPRAVKRFLNCYRLIKVGLRPAELEAFMGRDGRQGRYAAVMLLLGIITGAPTVSLQIIEELEEYARSKKTMNRNMLLSRLEENPEVTKQADWIQVREILEDKIGPEESSVTLETLMQETLRVSRYSFRVAKAAAGQKRVGGVKITKGGIARSSSPDQPVES